MDGGLFGRMLGRLKTGKRAIDLRALAMTGNEAMRLRVLREPTLDQKTLEILARRGSSEVRRQVANHPCFNAEAARQLVHLDDQEFQAAVKMRFGTNGVDGAPREVVLGPDPKVEYVPLVPGNVRPGDPWDRQPNHAEGAEETDSPASEPDSAIGEGDSEHIEIIVFEQVLPGDLVDLDDDPRLRDQEPWPDEALLMEGSEDEDSEDEDFSLEGSEDEDSPLEGSEDESFPLEGSEDEDFSDYLEEDPLAEQDEPATYWDKEFGETELSQEDLDLAYELIGSSADDEEGRPEEEWDPNLRDDSDIAELKLLEIFEKIPLGAAGDRLLERLAHKCGAPQLRFLKHLKDKGFDAEEVFLIWHVRDMWNESRGIGRFDQVLDYETVAKLVGMFCGTPETEEVLGVLHKLERRWKGAGDRRLTRNQYIRRWVWDQGGAWRSGGRPPLDLFLGD